MLGFIIYYFSKFIWSPKREAIELSNKFSNKVKRYVRSKYEYKINYWMVLK
jgi:hypothetical protein